MRIPTATPKSATANMNDTYVCRFDNTEKTLTFSEVLWAVDLQGVSQAVSDDFWAGKTVRLPDGTLATLLRTNSVPSKRQPRAKRTFNMCH